MSFNDLEGLLTSNQLNQTKLDHVIQKWLDMNGQGEGAPVTWNTILDVLKGLQEITRAMTIYDYLKVQSSVQQITQSKLSI